MEAAPSSALKQRLCKLGAGSRGGGPSSTLPLGQNCKADTIFATLMVTAPPGFDLRGDKTLAHPPPLRGYNASYHSLFLLALESARTWPASRRQSLGKMPLQERSRATVDALVEATARILVREGFEKASTNRIAEVAGVSVGSLYQYFPSKEALVAAVIDRHNREIMGQSAPRWRKSPTCRSRRLCAGS